jgi:hypothetical protein
MNEIEQEVAERVRAAVIQRLTQIWQSYWWTANDHRMSGRREDEYAAAKRAITINLARESIRMMDVEDLLAPIDEKETV